MMHLKNRPTSIVMVLVLLVYGWFYSKEISEAVSGKDTCVCAYDEFGYYMYLPQFFQHGNLNMQPEWAQNLQNTYCDSISAYQLHQVDNGNFLNIYHMGQAFVELPAYAVADLIAAIGGYPRDGFSKPYQIAFAVNALLFVLIGAFFCRKLLRLFFDERISAVLLVLLFFGTNYYITATQLGHIQHHYLFAIIAAMAYCLLTAWKQQNYAGKHFYAAVVLFGLCTVIRPTHVLLGIFPFLLLWKVFPSRLQFWWKMCLFGLSAFCWNIPQLLYWKIIGGSWLMLNLHVEELIIIDPSLWDFLFSFRKGWLLYTPLFLLLIPGFWSLRKTDQRLFWSLLGTTVVFIWIFASWECWWYASSFGSRVMVDLYPLLILPIGFLLTKISTRKPVLYIVSIFAGLTFLLNGLQSWQFQKGWLHHERMSYDHYAYIFGRMNIPGYDEHRLLIDRYDTTWVSAVQTRKDPQQRIAKIPLFQLWKPVTAVPGKDLDLTKFRLFDLLKTDETLIEVELEYSTSDSTQSSILRLETVSRFNAYQWENAELSLGKKVGDRHQLRMRFNLVDIHHRNDQLQVYIDNDQRAAITIYSMKLTGWSLVRE